MANCCCTSIYNYGCINHCDSVTVTGLEGESLTVTIQQASRQWVVTVPVVEGVANITGFNETGLHLIHFETPFAIGEETYDCIQVETKIGIGGGTGSTPHPSDLCSAIALCLASATPDAPAVQAPATVLIQNTTYSLEGYDLEFIGNTIDGDTLVRDFDANGNDLAGVGNSVIGGLFNSIRGVNNSIGDDTSVNTIIGENNSIGNGGGGNSVFGNDNTIGNNTNLLFIYGLENTSDDNVVNSSAFGIGHHLQCDLSYSFGRWSVCPQGGIAIGNGTSDLNRSNAHTLKDTGSYQHTGAYANKPTRYTGGGNHTIPDNVSVYIYDPASIQAWATITLPANPLDGQDLYIIGGGTITSGNVITGFTLDGNGRTVIGDGAANLKVGKAYELHYCGDNDIWYAIAF